MTVFEKIAAALKSFDFPHEPNVYTGCEKRYFTYNYSDERGSLFADDEALEITASVQVHLYLPEKEKFSKIKNKVKKALMSQGFTYPEVTILKDEDKHHIIFECDIEVEEE